MRIFQKLTSTSRPHFAGGPFTSAIQIRHRKPADTAQTRLDSRTLDRSLDRIAFHRRRLDLVLRIHGLVSTRKRGPFVSVHLLSRWAPHAGLDTLTAAEFLSKYPHVFQVFTHPIRKNACFRFTSNFVKLLHLEVQIVSSMEDSTVLKLTKILSMSVNGKLHLHTLTLMRRELGLPQDFKDSILRNHIEIFRMVDSEIVELANNAEKSTNSIAKIENWRAKEFTDKWLSEFEVKYAFPINFPTGFKIVTGFKEKLRNWQRLSYIKPYEKLKLNMAHVRTSGGVERYEKRAVGIIHELLCLTVEKMVPLERLAHFKKDLSIMLNLRELVLKHPGIFYLSTRGNTETVFLREAYSKGFLIEGNQVYDVRRKMLELILFGRRNTRVVIEGREDFEDSRCVERCENEEAVSKGEDFVVPIFEGR